MNFSEFKEKYFNGDEEEAIKSLAYEGYNKDYKLTKTGNQLQQIIDELDEEQANVYMKYYAEEIDKKPERFKKALTEAYTYSRLFSFLGMSPQEVSNTDKNPFAKKLLISMLVTVAGLLVFGVMLFIKKKANIDNQIYDFIIKYISSIFFTLQSFEIVKQIFRIFKFKKTKRYLKENPKIAEIDSLEESETVEFEEKHVELENTEANDGNNSQLTRITLIRQLVAFCDGNKKMYFWLGFLGIVILGFCCTFSVLFAIPTIGVMIVCGSMSLLHKNRMKKVLNMDFYVETLECIGKDYKTAEESNRTYDRKIYFKNGNEYKINYSHIGSEVSLYGILYSAEKAERVLYDSINVGDLCYAVHIGNETKISYALPCKEHNLSELEFINKDGKVIPVKNIDVEKHLEASRREQFESFTPKQQKDIKNAQEILKRTGAKTKTHLIWTAIVLTLFFSGIVYETVQALNVLVLPVLFIIPAIPAIKWTLKAGSAINIVAREYVDFFKLRDKQNLYVFNVVILIVNILLYLLNFLLLGSSL